MLNKKVIREKYKYQNKKINKRNKKEKNKIAFEVKEKNFLCQILIFKQKCSFDSKKFSASIMAH